MEKSFGLLVFAIFVALFAPILGSFLGALSGGIVGLVWEHEILDFMRRVGVDTDGLTLWQVGAAMGFLGGFLKTSVSNKEK